MNALIPKIRNNLFDFPEASLFDSFFNAFNVNNVFSEEKEWMPSIDITETDKEILLRAEVPGIDKKDINVTFTDGLLTIEGEKKQEKEVDEKNCKYMESRYGKFSRTLRLESEVEVEKVDASYKDGILKIKLPKAEKTKTKRIEVGS